MRAHQQRKYLQIKDLQQTSQATFGRLHNYYNPRASQKPTDYR